jgi:hypothetical protein
MPESYNMCFLGAVRILFIVFATPIVRLFAHEPDVVKHGAACLRVVASGYLFYEVEDPCGLT